MDNDADRFAFVKDTKIQQLLDAEWTEYCACRESDKLWIATIVLSGSLLEGMLLDDIMQKNPKEAEEGDKKQKHPLRMDLGELIDKVFGVQPEAESTQQNKPDPHEEARKALVGEGAICCEYLTSQAVRVFRNRIHPGRSIRESTVTGKGEADSVDHFLRVVHDALLRKYIEPKGYSVERAIARFSGKNPPRLEMADQYVRNMDEDCRRDLL